MSMSDRGGIRAVMGPMKVWHRALWIFFGFRGQRGAAAPGLIRELLPPILIWEQNLIGSGTPLRTDFLHL
jgi:hypothetical protein